VRALRGVTLEVAEGEIVAVLGNNGAGKSTLLRAISGTLALQLGTIDSGSIELRRALRGGARSRRRRTRRAVGHSTRERVRVGQFLDAVDLGRSAAPPQPGCVTPLAWR